MGQWSRARGIRPGGPRSCQILRTGFVHILVVGHVTEIVTYGGEDVDVKNHFVSNRFGSMRHSCWYPQHGPARYEKALVTHHELESSAEDEAKLVEGMVVLTRGAITRLEPIQCDESVVASNRDPGKALAHDLVWHLVEGVHTWSGADGRRHLDPSTRAESTNTRVMVRLWMS